MPIRTYFLDCNHDDCEASGLNSFLDELKEKEIDKILYEGPSIIQLPISKYVNCEIDYDELRKSYQSRGIYLLKNSFINVINFARHNQFEVFLINTCKYTNEKGILRSHKRMTNSINYFMKKFDSENFALIMGRRHEEVIYNVL